ncbi:MAG: hypothetical protein V1771_05625 [Chloroflexota bacterium]
MIKRAVILIVGIAVVVAGRWFFFYNGSYSAPQTKTPGYEHITAPTPSAAKFTDSARAGTGTVLIDEVHDNQFTVDELSVLVERVLSRGYEVEYLNIGEKGKVDREREAALRARLSLADAFVVAVPRNPFTLPEIALVSDFVDKGGKLILVGDATRTGQINTLAGQFGVTFQADYLYNQKDNDGNFRNIFLKEFKQSALTSGLQQVVLYSASSITPTELGLAFTDANTFSNLIHSQERFSPILISQNNRVLAISDLTLMGEPYNAAYDDNRFIANIADWLTQSERKFLLSDFPHFFRGKVKIELADPKFADLGLKVRSALQDYRKTGELGKLEGGGVFLGLFSNADNVSAELRAGGISIATEKETSVEIRGIGQAYRPETALLYLYSDGKNRTLILLADVESGLQRLVDGLAKGDFRQWLVRDDLALSYLKKPETPTPKPVEKPAATVKP